MTAETTPREGESIALFGGSFDPVHLGHLLIAEVAVEQMGLDRVVFLPCRISPHKQDGPPPAPGPDRLAMLELATAELDWAEVDDFDLNQPTPSYSYLTVEEMRRRHPLAKLYWLLGRDQWEALPRWREPELLARSVEFIVFSRNGAPTPREGWVMHHLEGVHPASATAIRQSIALGRTTDHLPPLVHHYIREHRLYGAKD